MTDADAPGIETKTRLRQDLRARRRAFVEEANRAGDLLVATLFAAEAALPLLYEAKVAAFYVAAGFEIDPLPLLLQAVDRGIPTVLPRVTARDAAMTFHHWLPGDPLERSVLGVEQPTQAAEALAPDIIFTPLVGFDRRLNRIGQGAGFYDRAFAALPDARRIGLAWSVQEADDIPADPWDVPLHAVATERGLIRA